jgi:hypothetical protein
LAIRPIVWAALGVACLLVGLPLSLAFRLGIVLLFGGSLLLGLAGAQWLWDRARRPRRGSEDDDL